MVENLKQKTVTGVLWRGLETLGSSGSQLVVSILLARLLLPEQFGLVAMLAVFMQLADVFVASGFPKALIQKPDVTRVDESSVFYFNLLVALGLYGLFFLIAPWVASFYGQPQLVLLLRVLALRIVIGSFGQIQQTLLSKQLDFKRQVLVGWGSMLISGIVGVVLAWKGFGVWALVAQQLLASGVRVGLLWIVSSWRPAAVFDVSALRSMFHFGSRMLASSLLDTAINNIYMVMIGKMFSPIQLGFYHRAHSLPSMLMNSVNGTVASVMFPSYSAMQDDPERMKRAARRSLKVLYFIVLPLMLGLAAVAEPLVRLLLTEKWLPCVPYLRILSVVYATGPLHVINLQIITALGRSDLFFRLEVIKAAIDICMILITFRFGVYAMVLGQMVTCVFAVVLNAYYNQKLIKYSLIQQMMDLLPTIGIAVLMGLAVWAVGLLDFGGDLIQLVVQMVCGALVYFTVCFITKLEGCCEALAILRERVRPTATGTQVS